MTAITWGSIAAITALMLWPHFWRCHVRHMTVRRVRTALASWPSGLLMQPTGGDPPTSASGCSRTAGSVTQTSGPAVPARAHLEGGQFRAGQRSVARVRLSDQSLPRRQQLGSAS